MKNNFRAKLDIIFKKDWTEIEKFEAVDELHESYLVSINNLLEKLIKYGGKIVCTSSLNVDEINQARASNRMFVDDDGFGYVWIPNLEYPISDEDLKLHIESYPLPDYHNVPIKISNKLDNLIKTEFTVEDILRFKTEKYK